MFRRRPLIMGFAVVAALVAAFLAVIRADPAFAAASDRLVKSVHPDSDGQGRPYLEVRAAGARERKV